VLVVLIICIKRIATALEFQALKLRVPCFNVHKKIERESLLDSLSSFISSWLYAEVTLSAWCKRIENKEC